MTKQGGALSTKVKSNPNPSRVEAGRKAWVTRRARLITPDQTAKPADQKPAQAH